MDFTIRQILVCHCLIPYAQSSFFIHRSVVQCGSIFIDSFQVQFVLSSLNRYSLSCIFSGPRYVNSFHGSSGSQRPQMHMMLDPMNMNHQSPTNFFVPGNQETANGM